MTTTVFHSVILSSKNHVNDHVNTNASSKINNHNFHLGFFFFWGGGEGELKGNLDGADGIAALFKESLCICAASCWFSHDVTTIQTKKLSILPRFYFHDALEQLKTNFHTNFRFKRVLGFVIDYA